MVFWRNPRKPPEQTPVPLAQRKLAHMLPGQALAEKLAESGLVTFSDLQARRNEDFTAIKGVGPGTAAKLAELLAQEEAMCL